MTARQLPRPANRKGAGITRLVVEDAGLAGLVTWSVITQANVLGMLTWTTELADIQSLSDAEWVAGYHDTPPIAWMLHDPDLGWRRSSGHGWVDNPSIAGRWGEIQAQEIAAHEPGLVLKVVRGSGLITCPDTDWSTIEGVDTVEALVISDDHIADAGA